MTAKSNAREGDGVAVTDAMLEAACARYFGPGGALGFPAREMRAALEAAMQAQQGAEPVALIETPMVDGMFSGKEPAYRMDAYYYGFAHTGVDAIDRILSAVACAGKSFHHTEQWNEDAGERAHLRGETPVDWIWNAACDAAAAMRAIAAPATGAPR